MSSSASDAYLRGVVAAGTSYSPAGNSFGLREAMSQAVADSVGIAVAVAVGPLVGSSEVIAVAPGGALTGAHAVMSPSVRAATAPRNLWCAMCHLRRCNAYCVRRGHLDCT